jgi:nucleoside-diphosphate-sugar epimerase
MIAVTGGAGFIGTKLVALLRESGQDVRILDTRQSTRFPELSSVVDVRELDLLTEALEGCRLVYHLAAEHRDDVFPVERYYDVNGRGTAVLVAAAERCGINSIIFTSTVALYGLGQGESDEAARPLPFNDYGKSKLQAEESLRSWAARNTNRRLVVVRLAATFGPGNRGNLHRMIDGVYRHRFVVVGSGVNRKSIAYVKNVAAFLNMGRGLGLGTTVVNYADKPDLTTAELVSVVRQALGRTGGGPRIPLPLGIAGGFIFGLLKERSLKGASVVVERVRKFSSNTVIQTSALGSMGFDAPFSLQQGLCETVAEEYGCQVGGAALTQAEIGATIWLRSRD